MIPTAPSAHRRDVHLPGSPGSSRSQAVRDVSLFSTLHSPSREQHHGTLAKQSVAVPTREAVDFPQHLTRYFRQLSSNVDALEDLFRRVGTFTQTEAYMAGSKGNILFQSQRVMIDEVIKCCESEVNFLSSKLIDSKVRAASAFESPEAKSDAVGWNSIYCSLAAVSRVCNAVAGALFVIPGGVSDSELLGKSMKLACLVSATKLTPLAKGALHADVFDLALTVAQTRCSLNAKTSTDGRFTKQGFSTVLACPVFFPRGGGSPCGVIILLDRVPPLRGAAKLFTAEDEGRVYNAAETIAEILDTFQLVNSNSFVSPTNFENTWNVATHEETVLRSAFRDPPPRGFVFRDEGVVPSTASKRAEMKSSKQRVVIEQSSRLMDSLQKCSDLEQELSRLQDDMRKQEAENAALQDRVRFLKQENERALRNADGMRMANELILRNSFVVPLLNPEDPAGVATSCEAPSVSKRFKKTPTAFTVGPQSARRTRAI